MKFFFTSFLSLLSTAVVAASSTDSVSCFKATGLTTYSCFYTCRLIEFSYLILLSSPLDSFFFFFQQDCEECPYGSYFLYVEKTGNPYGIQQAINATPPDCALAPIRTEGDVLAAGAAVTSGFAYLGGYRPTDVFYDDCGTGTCMEGYTGWLNYDGTEIPENPSVWATHFGPLPRVQLAIAAGGTVLLDAKPSDNGMTGAVYKCCVPGSTVCPLDNPVILIG